MAPLFVQVLFASTVVRWLLLFELSVGEFAERGGDLSRLN